MIRTPLFYRFMCWYDAYWRRKHGVEKFDELLSFSLEQYAGDRFIMDDGTAIEPGDCLVILHFNRECFTGSSANPKDYIRNALRFRKLLLSSFGQLANVINTDEKFVPVKAFHGISWLPPHGEKLGFRIERLPDSMLNQIRRLYFKVLLKTFFPHIASAAKNSIHPHAYWLSRRDLIKNFATEHENEFLIKQQ